MEQRKYKKTYSNEDLTSHRLIAKTDNIVNLVKDFLTKRIESFQKLFKENRVIKTTIYTKAARPATNKTKEYSGLKKKLRRLEGNEEDRKASF